MQAYAATPTIQNGVTIGGIDVSGMNDMEAAEAVNNKVNSDISSEIIIHCVEGKIATLPVKDINLKWKNTNVPTEAMSYGNACLVSDIPECAEVVADKAALAAEPMSDWTVYRLTGDTLKNLAETPQI